MDTMTPKEFLAEWQRRYDAQMAALRTAPAKALAEMTPAELRQEIKRRLELGMAEVMEKYDAEQIELFIHGDPNATPPAGLLQGRKSHGRPTA